MRYDSNGCTVYAELDDATQYATVYETASERPVATLQRRRVVERDPIPRWSLYATDGTLLRKWRLPRSYQGLVNDSALAIAGAREGTR